MLVGYFDESSTLEDPEKAFVLAGYLATPETWLEFEVRWKRVLDEHGSPSFHATDLFAKRNGFEAFDNARTKALMIALVDVAVNLDLYAVATGISWTDYTNWLNAHPLIKESELGSHPYFPCFHLLMARIYTGVASQPPDVRVALVLEQQSEFQGAAMRIFQEIIEGPLPHKDQSRIAEIRRQRDDPPATGRPLGLGDG
ncbi:MAG: hypothetical protein JNK60_16420 [Acidobacteria bacterium]|nr:hypothetical protein [Acidobacteriota bacterium]